MLLARRRAVSCTSQTANTLASGRPAKLRTCPPPIRPVPMQPMVMRSLGAALPSAPRAEAGIMVGNATAALVSAVFKKSRRDGICAGLPAWLDRIILRDPIGIQELQG